MYHLELRHFPHSAWRFNLSDAELRALLEPWVRQQVIDVGERKWNPHIATLIVLEGPRLEVTQLSMGRGWRSAQRHGEDVTERVLAAAAAAASAQDGALHAHGLGDPVALGVQLAALLGPDPIALLEAWRAAAASSPGLAPSESLARAEQAVSPSRAEDG